MTVPLPHLRRCGHEPGFPRENLLIPGEDSGDAVRLGDQGGVDHREGEAGKDSGHGAREGRGACEERDGRAVGDHHAHEDDVGELSRRGLGRGGSAPDIENKM